MSHRIISVVIVVLALAVSAFPAEAQLPTWIDLQAITLAARYRVIEDSTGAQTSNHLQEQNAIRLRVQAAPRGRAWVNVGVFSGGSLTSSWNNTGLGTGAGTARIRVKQLYASATPVKDVEVQVGGLYVVRGESTEITTYDNDAYLAGERLSIRRPDRLWLDEVSITHGYLGDLNTPNFFDRADRMGDSNYRQVLVARKAGPRVRLSADWTDAFNGTTWRGAAAVRVGRLVDAVRLELYTRPDDDASGAAMSAERRFARGVVLSGGYANIDGNFGGVNADRFNRGERLFGLVTVPIAGPLVASVFYTHAMETDFVVPLDQRFDVVVSWNLLESLRKYLRR